MVFLNPYTYIIIFCIVSVVFLIIILRNNAYLSNLLFCILGVYLNYIRILYYNFYCYLINTTYIFIKIAFMLTSSNNVNLSLRVIYFFIIFFFKCLRLQYQHWNVFRFIDMINFGHRIRNHYQGYVLASNLRLSYVYPLFRKICVGNSWNMILLKVVNSKIITKTPIRYFSMPPLIIIILRIIFLFRILIETILYFIIIICKIFVWNCPCKKSKV